MTDSRAALEERARSYREWKDSITHCIPGCDGDLPGEVHDEDCPMRKVPNSSGRSCGAGLQDAFAAGRRSAITEHEREKLALQMLRELAEAKPHMKLVSAVGVILGSLRPPTAEDIRRGQEIAKKLELQEKTK